MMATTDAHNSHHLGQVVLLRQMLGAWPAIGQLHVVVGAKPYSSFEWMALEYPGKASTSVACWRTASRFVCLASLPSVAVCARGVRAVTIAPGNFARCAGRTGRMIHRPTNGRPDGSSSNERSTPGVSASASSQRRPGPRRAGAGWLAPEPQQA